MAENGWGISWGPSPPKLSGWAPTEVGQRQYPVRPNFMQGIVAQAAQQDPSGFQGGSSVMNPMLMAMFNPQGFQNLESGYQNAAMPLGQGMQQRAVEGFGGQMQGALGQMGSQLNANADRQSIMQQAQLPLMQEQMRQQGQTQRLGMLSPILSAMFSRMGGSQSGGQQGFQANFGQAAYPGSNTPMLSPDQNRQMALLYMKQAGNNVGRQIAGQQPAWG